MKILRISPMVRVVPLALAVSFALMAGSPDVVTAIQASGSDTSAQAGETAATPPAKEPAQVKLSRAMGEVLKLSKAGVDLAVIRAYVDNHPYAYNPTADQIIALRNAGVPADIVTALVQHHPNPQVVLAPRTQPGSGPPGVQPQGNSPAPQSVVSYAPQPSGSSVYVIPYPTSYVYPGYTYAYPGWASFNYWPYYGYSSWPYSTWGYRGCYGYPRHYYAYGSSRGYRGYGYNTSGPWYPNRASYRGVSYPARFTGGYAGHVSSGFHSSGRASMSGPSGAHFGGGGFRGGGSAGFGRGGHR